MFILYPQFASTPRKPKLVSSSRDLNYVARLLFLNKIPSTGSRGENVNTSLLRPLFSSLRAVHQTRKGASPCPHKKLGHGTQEAEVSKTSKTPATVPWALCLQLCGAPVCTDTVPLSSLEWDPQDSHRFSSVQSLSRVHSTPGLPVHHQLPEFIQTHVHRVSDAIQPSHPLSSPSPPAFNLSQHQGLFQWVNSSHEVAKVLEFQLQHQSFQWIFRTDLLQNGLVGSPCSPRDSQESSPTRPRTRTWVSYVFCFGKWVLYH